MIKNIFKSLGLVLLFISPFWIARILLIFLNNELAIKDYNLFDYSLIAFRFDLKTMTIWYGLLFVGMGINLFLNSKVLRKVNGVLFALLLLSALVFNLINVFYYPISKNIAGIELFTMIGGQEWSIIFSYLLDYWYLILVALVIVYLTSKAYSLLTLKLNLKSKIVLVSVSILFLFAFARGSFSLKPLNSLDAFEVLPADGVKTAVTPFYVLIESYGKKPLKEVNYFSEDEVNAALKKNRIVLNSLRTKKPNICIILLESFGKEYTGLNEAIGPSYTPFLDSLMSQSINYTNAYANGLRSMDAVASIYTGIPSLMDQSFVGSLYIGNTIKSVFQELHNLGYNSSFYHAADEQSMSFKSYLTSAGLDKYVAKQQYPNLKDYDGTWGIFDEPFLQYFANELSTTQQPWFASVFTLSSHHPYTVPEKYSNLPKGTLPIHKAVRYSDLSLRNFFKHASSQPWFNNTVFIITADHSSINENKRYKTHRGRYEIPLMVYAPAIFQPQKVGVPVQHIDLYPTVLQLAGYKDSIFTLGKSILDSTYSPIIHYEGNRYSISDTTYVLEMIGEKKFKVYNYRKDPKYTKNLSKINVARKEAMEKKLKLYIQKFNYSIINNRFY